MYVQVPSPLTKDRYIKEFGADAFLYYQDRIDQRTDDKRVYLNPLKTMYIWSYKDRLTHQGYYSNLFIRNRNSRRLKNHGRS